MENLEFAELIAKHHLTFYWGAINKRWWISLTSDKAGHQNIVTIPADDFKAAQTAARDYILRKFK